MADDGIVLMTASFDVLTVTQKNVVTVRLTRDEILNVTILKQHILAVATVIGTLEPN